MERTVYRMVGLPASGKSTSAKEMVDNGWAQVRINFDLMREMFFFSGWTREKEKFIHAAAKAIAKCAFDAGYKGVVMDNTGLSKTQQDLCSLIAQDNNAEVKIVDFTWVPVEECIARDSRRGDKSVGEKVIRDTWNKYVRPPCGAAGHDLTLPQCIIVDLDGTIFDHGEERSPYDWDKVYNDEVRNHVATVVRLLAADGYKVVFVSGREDIGKCRSETVRCIQDKLDGVSDYELYMRPKGDHRADYFIKTELYDKHIRGRYDVFAIFDDREQVIDKAWAALGFDDRIFRVGRVHGDDF